MKIAIDGVRLVKKPTGVADITISIINSISQNFSDIEIFILTYDNLAPEIYSQIIFSENVQLVIRRPAIFKKVGLYWSTFVINRMLKELKPDTFIAPNFLITPFLFPKSVRVVVYVHDLVFKKYPETMNLVTKLNINAFFEKTLRRADVLWTNSNYTMKELVKFFPAETRRKSIITGGGVNYCLLEQIRKLKATKSARNSYGKYLLFVGTIEPRKNIPFLLEFFDKIKHKGYSLVVVGDRGWGDIDKTFKDIYSKDGFPKDRIIYTGYVTSQELVNLYKSASMLINTSINEGLGLPLLEAMACGCPVIAPHNSAMIEVVDGAGITVKTWDFKEWENALTIVEENRSMLIERGYTRLLKFDWKEIIISNFSEIMPGYIKIK
jgi:glycosyltransferase involved in cell wall biosynthesis